MRSKTKQLVDAATTLVWFAGMVLLCKVLFVNYKDYLDKHPLVQLLVISAICIATAHRAVSDVSKIQDVNRYKDPILRNLTKQR